MSFDKFRASLVRLAEAENDVRMQITEIQQDA